MSNKAKRTATRVLGMAAIAAASMAIVWPALRDLTGKKWA